MTNTSAKMAVTGGLLFTLTVNLAMPFAAKGFHTQETAYADIIHIKAHHFDIGSLSGEVQWIEAGHIRIPMT